MNLQAKNIEIFCGTGGVGKTTLATSRAFFLSQQKKNVLLITIDPAKRLKQVLNLSEDKAGQVEPVPDHFFQAECQGEQSHRASFDALLMSSQATLERVVAENNVSDAFKNRILNVLSRPYSGMNEILALLEVQYHLQTNKYDSIVLDTPPGKHFLDFLESCRKIRKFFDKSYIDIFKYLLKEKTENKAGILQLAVTTGLKKLLAQLEKVTGGAFIQEFIQGVGIIYKLKNSFFEGLALQDRLTNDQDCNWFLVSSVEHNKLNEAIELQNSAQNFMNENRYMALNKCLSGHSDDWEQIDNKTPLGKLKNSLLKRENDLKSYAQKNFDTILIFDEVLDSSPKIQVHKLAEQWEKHTKGSF